MNNFTRRLRASLKAFAGIAAASIFALTTLIPPQIAKSAPPLGFQTTPVITSGLDGPSGFEIAPDGRIFILERTGTIKIYKNGQLLPTPFAELPSIAAGDRGLIGIAFDPDFDVNCYVYFYYTSASDLLNRLVRFNACGDVGTDGPYVIYQTNSPSQELHVGGSIRFGADGKMYFAVGDNGYPPNGQDLSNPHGKILRINKDGTIPTDNPFYGQPGKLGEIWAYGFRNPWRFQFDSATNQLYGGDVGDFSWEEMNHIVKGGNYGWPLKEGYCAPNCGETIEPIYTYPHEGFSAAITGGPVYRGAQFPEEYRGDLFFGDYAQGFIKHIDLDENGNSLGVHDFDTNAGSVVDLKVAPDGSMYYLTYWPGRLYRVSYNSGNGAPTANATADITKGLDPLTVNFSSEGSFDPEDQTLTYAWDFGDDTTSEEANPSKTYLEKGTYTVELTVSDGENFAQAVPLVIQVGTPPTVRISVPAEGSTYKAGDIITYNAFANDAAGFDINDAAISTDILLHHDTHTHPFVDNMIGRANSFTIPDHGEASANTWYEIITTATDTNGLAATARVNIYPEKVNLSFGSNVPGIGVYIDGVPYPSPYTTQGVVNFTRELSAAPIAKGADGNYYQFDHWSDGGAIRHGFRTPNADTTYTAFYVPAPGFTAEYFANQDLAGEPVLVRTEADINHNWGDLSPDPTVPENQFSARYTNDQYFAAGRYKFATASDDGVRLYVDGQLLIDGWLSPPGGQTATINLEAGLHEIRFEYFEGWGGAYVRLNWETTPDQPSTGYTAQYFNNMTLSGTPALTRTDAIIDFTWDNGSPASNIQLDGFSARWSKTANLSAGMYTFTVTADDGVRLYVDGQLALDKWIDQGSTTYTVTRALGAGDHTIVLEYYENGGGAVAKMNYAKTGPLATDEYPSTGYYARYWNFAPGTVVPEIPTTPADVTRVDPTIDFAWNDASPDPAINLDNFVARWQHHHHEPGTYRFTVTSDDGVRVYADGELILDKWVDQGSTTYTIEKTFTEHWNLAVEYYEKSGGAVMQFDYEEVVSTPVIATWNAEYWNVLDMAAVPTIPGTPADLTREENAIDYAWEYGAPALGITIDSFIARWAKTDTFTTGTYRFTTTSDDGIRVYVDGALVLDDWSDHAMTTTSVDVPLTAGQHQIVVEYYERGGGAVAKMQYELLETP